MSTAAESTSPGPGATNLVGGYDFKGRHVVAWFSGNAIPFPAECPCCGGTGDLTEAEVLSGEGEPWFRYPLCATCKGHAEWDDRAMLMGVLGSLVLTLGGYYLLFGFAVPRRGVWAVGIMIFLVFVGISYVLYQPLAGRGVTEDCADAGWPLARDIAPDGPLLGEDAERSDDREARKRSTALRDEAGPAGVGVQISHRAWAAKLLAACGTSLEDLPRVEEKL